jgi:hypothetical protein
MTGEQENRRRKKEETKYSKHKINYLGYPPAWYCGHKPCTVNISFQRELGCSHP